MFNPSHHPCLRFFLKIYFCINDFYDELLRYRGVARLKFRSWISSTNALVKSTIVLSVDFIVFSALQEAEFINLGRFGLKQELTEFNFMNTQEIEEMLMSC